MVKKYNIKLLKKRLQIKAKYQYSQLTHHQKIFLKKSFLKVRSSVILFLVVATLGSVTEMFIIIFLRKLLPTLFNSFQYDKIGISLIIVLFTSFLFLGFTYLCQMILNDTVLKVINSLKLFWYQKILSKQYIQSDSTIFIHITYFYSLLKQSITSLMDSSVKVILNIFLAFIFTLVFINHNLHTYIFAIIISLVIFVITMIIGHKITLRVLEKERTFSSSIIRNFYDILVNRDVYLKEPIYKSKIQEFKEILEYDKYFRVRRTVFIGMFNKLIYISIFFIYFFINYSRRFNTSIDSNLLEIADIGILSTILIRTWYKCLTVASSLATAQIAIRISIPQKGTKILNYKRAPNFNKISFISSKTKLSQNESYFKNLKISFEKHCSYFVDTENTRNNYALSRLLGGISNYLNVSWNVVIDKQIYSYNYFKRFTNISYLIDGEHSQKSIAEIILSKNTSQINADDIRKVSNYIKKYNLKKYLGNNKGELSMNISSTTSTIEIVTYELLHCLIKKPQMVVFSQEIPPLLEKTQIDYKQIINEIKEYSIPIFIGWKIRNVKIDHEKKI